MFVAVACLAILTQPFAYAVPGRSENKEEKLAAKIEREKNPGKKARLQIRLAKLKLKEAEAAYARRDFAQGRILLRQYLDQVKSSWATLEGTENAVRKHVRAFMEIEISLREDDRFLDDMRRHIPYPESEGIKEVEKESSAVHNQVLEKLFPGGFPRKERSPSSMPPESSLTVKVGVVES